MKTQNKNVIYNFSRTSFYYFTDYYDYFYNYYVMDEFGNALPSLDAQWEHSSDFNWYSETQYMS